MEVVLLCSRHPVSLLPHALELHLYGATASGNHGRPRAEHRADDSLPLASPRKAVDPATRESNLRFISEETRRCGDNSRKHAFPLPVASGALPHPPHPARSSPAAPVDPSDRLLVTISDKRIPAETLCVHGGDAAASREPARGAWFTGGSRHLPRQCQPCSLSIAEGLSSGDRQHRSPPEAGTRR